jgi:hypothetical protein
VKIAPPLTITEAALREGISVLAEAIDEVLAGSTEPPLVKNERSSPKSVNA